MREIFFLIAITLLFTACSQTQEEKKKEPTNRVTTANDIVITENEKAYESKVKSANNVTDRSYYYSYNEKTKDKEQRTQVDANLHIRSGYEELQISHVVKKLSRDFALRCSPCHNDYANGVIGPSLLSSSADEIYNNMMQYKNGEKKNALMVEIIAQISDADIKSFSQEIATFNESIKKIKSATR